MVYALKTTDFPAGTFDPAKAAPIVTKARDFSAIMQLGRQIPLSEGGTRVAVSSSNATASIVGETDTKPKYKPAITDLFISKSKFALISVLSAETARANPYGVLGMVRDDMAAAFARALDRLALYGGVAGQGYVNQTTSTVELGSSTRANGGTYQDIITAFTLQAAKTPPRKNTGFVFDTKAEPVILSSVDLQGRPLWLDSPYSENAVAFQPGRILGRPSYIVEGLTEGTDSGFVGDWSKVVWGVLAAPNFRVVVDATYTQEGGGLRSTTENNEILVVGEFEAAAACVDPASFVKFTDANPVNS